MYGTLSIYSKDTAPNSIKKNTELDPHRAMLFLRFNCLLGSNHDYKVIVKDQTKQNTLRLSALLLIEYHIRLK